MIEQSSCTNTSGRRRWIYSTRRFQMPTEGEELPNTWPRQPWILWWRRTWKLTWRAGTSRSTSKRTPSLSTSNTSISDPSWRQKDLKTETVWQRVSGGRFTGCGTANLPRTVKRKKKKKRANADDLKPELERRTAADCCTETSRSRLAKTKWPDGEGSTFQDVLPPITPSKCWLQHVLLWTHADWEDQTDFVSLSRIQMKSNCLSYIFLNSFTFHTSQHYSFFLKTFK